MIIVRSVSQKEQNLLILLHHPKVINCFVAILSFLISPLVQRLGNNTVVRNFHGKPVLQMLVTLTVHVLSAGAN